MRERINRLANGFIENEVPNIKAEPETIEEELITGQWQGSFRIFSENHVQMKGLVYSDNPHVKVLRRQFKGYEATIGYQLKLHHKEEAEDISGRFVIVGNGCEREVPFHFLLSGARKVRTEARFETIEEFAAFVQEEKEAGGRLFNSPHFEKQPFMQNLSLQTLYEGLLKRGHRGNALEEFLVCSGVKEQVRLSVVDSARKYQMPEQEFSDCIRVEKNTWGSLLVQIKTDAPFLRLEKERITEKDFTDNQCLISYRIETEKLHGGLNFGRVLLETPYQSFAVDISACLASHREEAGKALLDYQKHLKGFTQKQLSYYGEIEEEGLLLNQMQAEISRIRSSYPTSGLLQILHAHIYMLQKKPELAALLLDDAYAGIWKCRQEEPDLYCYYLYVRNLLEEKPEQKNTLEKIVEKYAEEGVSTTLLFMLRLALNPRFSEDGLFFGEQLREQYDMGNRSPYLYLSAVLRWNKEPELLIRLDDFALQALYYGAKHGLLTEEISKRAAAFAASEKSFRKVYVRLLKRLYENFGNTELLSAVCTLLMKGNVRTPDSFFWYEKGVEADLRLTRLYEFYLCTRPEGTESPLPEELVRYYSFHHSLGYEAKVVLYRYILWRYTPGEEIYDAYREQMERFVMEQVLKGEMNEALAYLYQKVLYPEMIDEKAAKVLPGILFAMRIVCPSERMTHAVIRYEETREETVVPIREGRAYVPIYSKHYCLLLQDGYGNRYTGIACEIIPLMEREPLLSACLAIKPDCRPVEISRCRKLLEGGMYERSSIDCFREMAMDPALSPLFKERLISAVIHYFHNSREEEVFDRDILSLDAAAMSGEDRTAFLETLIDREYRKEAWELIGTYGYETVSLSRLLKLASRLITEQLYEKKENLLFLAGWLFAQENQDDVILEYLCEHENGGTQWMYRIWDAAVSAHVNTYDMEERLLAQMLFTGLYEHMDQVFQEYIRKKTADAMLVKAYFTVLCYQYFMEEKQLDEESFSYIEKSCMEEGNPEGLPLIHRLAVSRYYYSAFILTEEQMEFGRKLIYSILQEGKVFAYLKPLSRKLGIFHSIQNRQILEYKGEKEDQIAVRYRILPDMAEFLEEKMSHMYQGIFVKQLSAFESDTVEYEIRRKEGEDWETVRKDSVLVYSEEEKVPMGRFGYVNHLLFLEKGGEEAELKKAMEEYGIKETLAEKWFCLKE